MQLYVVGGAVRDALLGLPAADRDWVAVGATPEELIAQGYKPVGKDFPVFLHPQTREEVALARTERKTGPGYRGFTVHAAPGVTLEQDLARRDLTINAIAQAEDGTLHDPFGGQADLRAKVLRHVSPAFAEDPVRVLRLARFAARLPDFSVAPQTLALARTMVGSGEIDALVPERVWQELAGGLLAARPGRMLQVLVDCGAWVRLFPELHAAAGDAPQRLNTWASNTKGSGSPRTAVAWAILLVGAGASAQAAEAVSRRLRAPSECLDLAVMLAREAPLLAAAVALDAGAAVDLFRRCDAFRRPERFACLLLAAAGLGLNTQGLQRQFEAANTVDAQQVTRAAAQRGLNGPALAQALHEARLLAAATAAAAGDEKGGPQAASGSAP